MMSDDRNKRGPADRTRVNVSEDHEVRYWTDKLGCSTNELRAAVAAKGTSLADVRNWLSKR